MANLVWGRQKSGLCRGERASYEGGKDELRMVQVKRRWEPPQYKSCLLVISGCLTPAHTPHSQSRIIKLLSHTTSQHTHTHKILAILHSWALYILSPPVRISSLSPPFEKKLYFSFKLCSDVTWPQKPALAPQPIAPTTYECFPFTT